MTKTTQPILRMKVGRRAGLDENLPNNWEDINIQDLTVPKDKTIFVFGGNTTNRPEANNGNAKIVASLLNTKNSAKTKIYSFMYESEPIKSGGYLSKEFANDALALFENTFKPILFDKKGNMKEMKGIEQEFSKLVFVAHCGGSNFVDIIIDQFYNTLLEQYPPKTAELLLDKIQYVAYAPNELPEHNVNALYITPLIDSNYSWAKAFDLAENNKVDIDYPKGVVKEIFKAKKQDKFQHTFNSEFQKTRAIMFKIGNSTFFIPNQINPNKSVGDHSIECIARSKFLDSNNDCAINAKITNSVFKLYLNGFLNNNVLDLKDTFNRVSEGVKKYSAIADYNV